MIEKCDDQLFSFYLICFQEQVGTLVMSDMAENMLVSLTSVLLFRD